MKASELEYLKDKFTKQKGTVHGDLVLKLIKQYLVLVIKEKAGKK
jgi:hypothetical protein